MSAKKVHHPYVEYEREYRKLWVTLERGIRDLVENQDISEMTPREYIVGYLCKLMVEKKIVSVEKKSG